MSEDKITFSEGAKKTARRILYQEELSGRDALLLLSDARNGDSIPDANLLIHAVMKRLTLVWLVREARNLRQEPEIKETLDWIKSRLLPPTGRTQVSYDMPRIDAAATAWLDKSPLDDLVEALEEATVLDEIVGRMEQDEID